MTIEAMINKIFCPRTMNEKSFAFKLYNIVYSKKDVMYLAKAARKFVKMENEQRAERLKKKKYKNCFMTVDTYSGHFQRGH